LIRLGSGGRRRGEREPRRSALAMPPPEEFEPLANLPYYMLAVLLGVVAMCVSLPHVAYYLDLNHNDAAYLLVSLPIIAGLAYLSINRPRIVDM
jgi:hypothetical protein